MACERIEAALASFDVFGHKARLRSLKAVGPEVWVLRENMHARGFYERLGGVYLRQRPLDFGHDITAMEVSYLWANNLPTLLPATASAG